MHPRFSVVVPVYNRAVRVLPTLESVRDQAFRDFECIVVDDGSGDGEALRSVVEELRDPRFRYVRRDNGGGGAARNTGIDEAEGDFVAFLDSDDRWLPDKLRRDAEACADDYVLFSPVLVERGGRIVGRRPTSAPRSGEPVAEYLACRGGFTATSTLALPTKLARRVRFDETLPFGQDTDFAIRLASAGAEFRMIAEPSVVMLDDETGDRISRSTDWITSLAWLDRAKAHMHRKAYLAYRGTQVARMAAEAGALGTAVRFFGAALARGALSPSLAAKTAVQLMMRRSVYRKLGLRH